MSDYALYKPEDFSKSHLEGNMLKIFSRGDMLQFKHHSLSNIINAAATDINADTIRIQPKCSPNEAFFFPRDPVVLNLIGSGEYYYINAEILSVNSINPPDLTVKATSISNRKNMRRSRRFYVNLVSRIEAPDPAGCVFAVTKNISPGGVKINSKKDLSVKDPVDISINIDTKQKLAFRGKVVRKSTMADFFEYGIEIMEISKPDLTTLFHYINQLEAV